MAQPPPYTLKLLGGFELQGPQGVVAVPQMGQLLLAYLATEGPTSKYALAIWMWPDTPPEGAKANMRKLLQRLRMAAGRDLLQGESTLALAEFLAVDANQLSQAFLAGHYPEVAASEGGFLPELNPPPSAELENWLHNTRQAFEQTRFEACLSAATQQGPTLQGLALVRRALAWQPHSEEAQRLHMRFLALQGERGAALAAYASFRQRLQHEFGLEPAPATQELAQSIRQGQPSTTPNPPPSNPSPPLVGRQHEWALLEQAWQQRQAVIVSGPAGIGKTHLALAFVQAKGLHTLTLAARPGDSAIAYATLSRFLRVVLQQHPQLLPHSPPWVSGVLARLLPELASQTNPSDSALHLFEAIAFCLQKLLQQVQHFVIEDLHHFDPASLEALAYLNSRFAGPEAEAAPGLSISVRSEALSAQAHALLGRMVQAGLALWVELGPLSQQHLQQWLSALQPQHPVPNSFSEQLLRFTGGNPWWVQQTLNLLHSTGQLQRGWPAKLPPSTQVRTLVLQRLARLSPQAQHLAKAAALLGSDWDAVLLARAVGHPLEQLQNALAELQQAALLGPNGFYHELIAQSLSQELLPEQAAQIHGRIAWALQELNPQAARIAQHWQQAQAPNQAARWYLEAARQAQQAWRENEAQGYALKALEVYQALGDTDGVAQAQTWLA